MKFSEVELFLPDSPGWDIGRWTLLLCTVSGVCGAFTELNDKRLANPYITDHVKLLFRDPQSLGRLTVLGLN